MEIWEFRQKQALPYSAKIKHALNNELVSLPTKNKPKLGLKNCE